MNKSSSSLLLGILFTLIAVPAKGQVSASESGDGYQIKLYNQVLEVVPQKGGKIKSLSLDGENFLSGEEVNAKFWGSTFWPSPQKDWKGRLSPELDSKPYQVTIEENSIKLQSQEDTVFGYVVTKEIYSHTTDTSFHIRYTITNISKEEKYVAPWEITRVDTGGLAFFPKGMGESWGNMAHLSVEKKDIVWFEYQHEKLPAQNNKMFADGSEGWIAQINEDFIFVKKFPEIQAEAAAPTEAEVEIYVDPKKSYEEIEVQGAYQQLAPNESLIWEVTWYLRKLPVHIKPKIDHPALVDYVRKLVR